MQYSPGHQFFLSLPISSVSLSPTLRPWYGTHPSIDRMTIVWSPHSLHRRPLHDMTATQIPLRARLIRQKKNSGQCVFGPKRGSSPLNCLSCSQSQCNVVVFATMGGETRRGKITKALLKIPNEVFQSDDFTAPVAQKSMKWSELLGARDLQRRIQMG